MDVAESSALEVEQICLAGNLNDTEIRRKHAGERGSNWSRSRHQGLRNTENRCERAQSCAKRGLSWSVIAGGHISVTRLCPLCQIQYN